MCSQRLSSPHKVGFALLIGVFLAVVLVGCTSLFNPTRNATPSLKADSVSEPLSALGESCSTAILVRIKLKADRDDEPEENAEPVIQATACGQATGEAVPTGAQMQPLAAPPGGGDIGGGYEGPQICTSQWGYDYFCTQMTPLLSLSTTSLTVPQTFINQQTQASFVVWNSGGGRLTGTVSAQAPFSIVSGGSFSLLPGQPQIDAFHIGFFFEPLSSQSFGICGGDIGCILFIG